MEAAARKHYQGIRRIWESVKFRAGQGLQRPKHGSQAVSSAGGSCGWDEPMTFKVRASFSLPMSTRELTLLELWGQCDHDHTSLERGPSHVNLNVLSHPIRL